MAFKRPQHTAKRRWTARYCLVEAHGMRHHRHYIQKDSQRHDKSSIFGCLTLFLTTEDEAFSEREREEEHFPQSRWTKSVFRSSRESSAESWLWFCCLQRCQRLASHSVASPSQGSWHGFCNLLTLEFPSPSQAFSKKAKPEQDQVKFTVLISQVPFYEKVRGQPFTCTHF